MWFLPPMTEVFRKKLGEAKCPYCGSNGAYVGATSVECDNPGCDHHKPPKGQQATSRTVEFDIGEKEDEVEAELKQLGFRNVKVTPNGPGGGNPMFEVTPKDRDEARKLRKYLRDRVFVGDDDSYVDLVFDRTAWKDVK